MFQLLIWHFFVLTQKSTQKKSRQKDASSRIPSHPRLFVGPAHLSFKIKYSLRYLVSADWQWVYFKNTREVFNFIEINQFKHKPTTHEKGGIFSTSGKPL
jgi:hypothetical protein